MGNFLSRAITYPVSEIRSLLAPAGKGELPLLNGLRGISVLMIVFFHCFMLPVLLFYKDQPETLHHYIDQLPDILLFVFAFDKGVDIFFILSAYLLTSQLLVEGAGGRPINLSRFYLRRFFRIIPLYLLGLFLYAQLLDDLYPRLLHNLLFVDNYYHDSIISVGWSLSIEVQFYLVLPLVMLFLNKVRSWIPGSMVFLLILSLVIRYYVCLDNPEILSTRWADILNSSEAVFNTMGKIYNPTHMRFGLLILGMIWAYVDRNARLLARLRNLSATSSLLIFGLSMAVLLLSLQFPAYHQESWSYRMLGPEITIWWITLHRTVFGIAVIMICLVLEAGTLPRRMGDSFKSLLYHRAWRLPAHLSFPIYLFHFPIIYLAYLLVFQTGNYATITEISLIRIILVFFVATALTLIVAILLHITFEAPMIRKGKSLSRLLP